MSKLIPGKTYEPGMVALDELDKARARIASLEARLRVAEERDDWLRKQLDGLIESAEAVAQATGLATARAILGDLRDARKALATASGEGEAGE